MFNGYLSDVYFVDGQALEPEVFGKYFGDPGKWGPLDSSDVYANIKQVESPSDSCPNYDQKWSDGVVNDWVGAHPQEGDGEFAFDGDLQRNGLLKTMMIILDIRRLYLVGPIEIYCRSISKMNCPMEFFIN